MSKKRKCRSKAKGGRYTPPKFGRAKGSLHLDDDLELFPEDPDTIVLRLPGVGAMPHPKEFLFWISDQGLEGAYEDWMRELFESGTHGDAFTPFAVAHGAPASVLQAIAAFIRR